MLDSIQPYKITYIQKASPKIGDAFNFSYIYKFFAPAGKHTQTLKYIINAEETGDVFAIKFYASRDRKLDNKYNRILKRYSYKESMAIFITCASLVPLILSKHKTASFVINGAQTQDIVSDKLEQRDNTQRFRIYKRLASELFGQELFEHVSYESISSYLLLNKSNSLDIKQKKDKIEAHLLNAYDIEL